MTRPKTFQSNAASILVLAITLSSGSLSLAQGIESQPAKDSDARTESSAQAEAQKPADAVVIHEGGGPVDCASLLAQDSAGGTGTQTANVGRTSNTAESETESGSSPHRADQPGQDTQVSTLEECRAQQQAAPDQTSHDAHSD